MKVNPMVLIQMIKSGQNPQQLLMSVLEQQSNTSPMSANLLHLAKNNKTAEIEQIARNYTQQQGMDFDTEFEKFKRQIGVK